MFTEHSIDLGALVGAPGTRLLKVKNPGDRKRVSEMLKSADLDATVALRAYLVIKKPPLPTLLRAKTISAALAASDCVRFLPKLARKTSLVDAESALVVIQSAVQQDGKDSPWRIAGVLSRALAGWSKSRLTGETISSLIALASSIVSRTREARRPKTKNNPLPGLICSCVLLAIEARTVDIHFRGLTLTLQAVDILGAEMEHLLEGDAEAARAFQILLRVCLEDLARLAAIPDAPAVERCARILLRHRLTESRARGEIELMWSDRSKYANSLQLVLSDLLGKEADAPISLGIPDSSPESLRSLRLASSLLQSWEAKDTGPKASSAFGILEATLKDSFQIVLRGEPGEIAPFNPRLHEPLGRGPEPVTVRILRPRVELVGEPITSVLIKSVVDPIGGPS